MPTGRMKESEMFKSAYESYLRLSDAEKQVFRSKVFSSLLKGLSKESRKEFQSQRAAFLNSIQNKLQLEIKVQHLKDVPKEILEAALRER